MKIESILALVLVLVAIGSAATDDQIHQFARGAIAAHSGLESTNVSFNNDSMIIISKLEFGDGTLSGVAYHMFMLATAVDVVKEQYPERFKTIDIRVYNSSEQMELLGTANLTVSSKQVSHVSNYPVMS